MPMKYQVQCGESFTVKVKKDATNTLEMEVMLNDEHHRVTVSEIDEQGKIKSLMIDNSLYPVAVQAPLNGFPSLVFIHEKPFEVYVRGEVETRNIYELNRENPFPVKAVLPGVVMAICVEKGMLVKKGQKLIVLESMKMENEILAPSRGRVTEIAVSKDQQVTKGQLLLKIE